MSILLTGIGVFLLLGSSHSTELEGWQTIQIPCNYSNWKNILSINVTRKTKLVFADCGKRTFHLASQQLNISMVNDLRVTGTKASVIDCSCHNCTGTNAGINFANINNFHLENLQINNCYDSEFSGSLHIASSTNVTIKNITIENSRGTGLILKNNIGVYIMNSTFRSNGQEYGGSNEESSHLENLDLQSKFSGGGGLKILIGDDHGVKNSLVIIEDCVFLNNSALKGGGLFIVIQPRAQGNTVIIQSSHFTQNKCHSGGGGGLQIGYANENRSDTKAVIDNTINVQDCTFLQNDAEYGGGTAIFSTSGSSKNKLEFTNCSWRDNTAKLGMAVDIAIAPWETYSSNGIFPSPVFTDCTFSGHKHNNDLKSSRSVFAVTGFVLEFRGSTSFTYNNATAIDATSAVLDFMVNSNAVFIQNQAIYGGAMKFIGLSTIFIRDNSTFLFDGNKARHSGGAVYVRTNDKHSLLSSKSCFVQYKGNGEPRNLTLMFRNNNAGFGSKDSNSSRFRGDSVYATTIIPCLQKCAKSLLTLESVSATDALKCIGNFYLENIEFKRHVSTGAHHFSHTRTDPEHDSMCSLIAVNGRFYRNLNFNHHKVSPINGPLHIIPGKTEVIPLKLVDELCGEVFFHVSASVLESVQGSISVDPAYNIITDNHIVLYGNPQDSGVIQLSSVGLRDVSLMINVSMADCPPGYIHNYNKSDPKTCVCYSNTIGIERCNKTEFQAYVKHGYWVGYIPQHIHQGNPLAKAVCPKGFCFNSSKSSREHPLPSESGNKDLSPYICNSKRTGTLCGTCKKNYSASYHSMSFSCKSNDLCNWGWAFYILSELVPITLFFLAVIFFNISFTSGPLNGVVFFMQVVDTLRLNAENFVDFGQVIYVARIQKFAYRIFSLNTFAIEELSFCLWSGASALDMLAFRYVTIVYSLFLVIATALFIRICSREKINLKRSIIHGLSAFLVVSYSECTRVSLLILTLGTLSTITVPSEKFYVSFYNGEYPYMGPEHLRYALPAILFIMTMVSIPPLLLLSYPLCYKLFALLRIEESRCVQITCKIFPLERIKPLFDSVQGTFKDRYRFFAGLYFLYRLCLLLTFTYTSTLPTYYTITGIQLMCMLALHAMCRPYKNTWHNILDALLFLSLAVINAITFSNYQLTSSYANDTTIQKVATVQILLVLSPFVFLIIYIVYHIVKRIKAAFVRNFTPIEQEDVDNSNDVIDILDNRQSETDLDLKLLSSEPS